MSLNNKSQKPRLALVSNVSDSSFVASAPSTASESIAPAKRLSYSKVIKSEDLAQSLSSGVSIDSFVPSEVVGKRAVVHASSHTPNGNPPMAVAGLRQNLKTLNELQSRLRFVLGELEELA